MPALAIPRHMIAHLGINLITMVTGSLLMKGTEHSRKYFNCTQKIKKSFEVTV